MKKLPLLMLIVACNTKPQAIKTVTKNGVTLQVKKDDKAVKGGYEAFLIRITYPHDRTFTREQLDEMTFGWQNDVVLIAGDTSQPVFFQKIATGMSDQAEYLAAFDRQTGPKETLQITDGLFGLGRQQLTW